MSNFKVTTPESSGTLEFFSGEARTLAVIACAAWERGTNARTRDGFRDTLRMSLQHLVSGGEIGLHERADEFTVQVGRKKGHRLIVPEGYAGFSLAMIYEEGAVGSNTYHTRIVTFQGRTGVITTNNLSGLARPQMTPFGNKPNLFAMPPLNGGPASSEYLLFTGERPTVYLGEREQLAGMQETGHFVPFSQSHGSIVPKVTAVSASASNGQEGHLLIDPVEHHYGK